MTASILIVQQCRWRPKGWPAVFPVGFHRSHSDDLNHRVHVPTVADEGGGDSASGSQQPTQPAGPGKKKKNKKQIWGDSFTLLHMCIISLIKKKCEESAPGEHPRSGSLKTALRDLI